MTIKAPLLFCSALAIACGSPTKEPEAAKTPVGAVGREQPTQPTPPTVASPPGVATQVGSKAKCPVSGEEFVVAESSPKVTYEGKDYYFCCASCADEFKADPKKYVK